MTKFTFQDIGSQESMLEDFMFGTGELYTKVDN